jgi:UDP-glucuronate decarboxylase
MDTPAGFTGPVNIGNPTEFTIKSLAELIIDQTRSRSTLVHLPLPPDDPRQRRPDISLARTHLDWQPRVPLAEGLIPTIAHFAARLDAEPSQASIEKASPRRSRRHLRDLAT